MLSLNSSCGFCEVFRTEEKHGRRPTGTPPFLGQFTPGRASSAEAHSQGVLKGPSSPVAGKGSSHHPSVAMHIFPYRVTVQTPPTASSKHFPRPRHNLRRLLTGWPRAPRSSGRALSFPWLEGSI